MNDGDIEYFGSSQADDNSTSHLDGSLSSRMDTVLSSVFSDAQKMVADDSYGKQIADQVIAVLHTEAFSNRIKTPDDVHHYADKVLEVARLRLKYDEQGSVTDGQYEAANYTAETFTQATQLIRGDFDHDLDTLLQMMRDNPSPDQREGIIDSLGPIRDLIHTSDDLERIGQFVKSLAENGFDAKTIFSDNSRSDESPNSIFGKQHDETSSLNDHDKAEYVRYKEWQTVLTDSQKLDDALSLAEAGFTHGIDPGEFLNGIGRHLFQKSTPEQLKQIETDLSLLGDEISSAFFNKEYSDAKRISREIFKSLSFEPLSTRITTPKEFEQYARKVVEIATLFEDAYDAERNLVSTVKDAVLVTGQNFDRDLDILIQIMRDVPPKRDREGNVIHAVSLVKQFIHTSEDLERVGIFVKRASDAGFSACDVLQGVYKHRSKDWQTPPIFGLDYIGNKTSDPSEKITSETRAFWSSNITDSKELDTILTLVESGFTNNVHLNRLINSTIGRRLINGASSDSLSHLHDVVVDVASKLKLLESEYTSLKAETVWGLLDQEPFASRINTSEDLHRYANMIIEIMNASRGAIFYENQTEHIIPLMKDLVRGDFDRDFRVLIQMMQKNPLKYNQWSVNRDVIDEVHNIRNFINTSGDLEHIDRFVTKLSNNGIDAKKYIRLLFGDSDVNSGKEEEQHFPDKTFNSWKEIIVDSKKLNEVLTIIETAFLQGSKPDSFVKTFNGFSVNEKMSFIDLAKQFNQKNIPLQFVLENIMLLKTTNFSKKGLDIFSSEAKRKWLEYCVETWEFKSYAIQNNTQYFDEALQAVFAEESVRPLKLKGLQNKRRGNIYDDFAEQLEESLPTTRKPDLVLREFAASLLKRSLENFVEHRKLESIVEISEHLDGSKGILEEIDAEHADQLTRSAALEILDIFEIEEIRHIFPRIYKTAVQIEYERLLTDSIFNTDTILEFQTKIGAGPSKETLDTAFIKLIGQFIESDGYQDEDTAEVILDHHLLDRIHTIQQLFSPQYEFDSNFVKEAYQKIWVSGELNYYKIQYIKDLVGVEPSLDEAPIFVQSLAKQWNSNDVNSTLSILMADPEYTKYLASQPNEPSLLTSVDLKKVKSVHLTLLEAEKMKRAGIDIVSIDSEEMYKTVFETLCKIDEVWQDEQNISTPFRAGARVFGYQRMFAYADRRRQDSQTHEELWPMRVTRHDTLHAFPQILKMYEVSQMKQEVFYNNILRQVIMDDSSYESGSAHEAVNEIAMTANFDLKELLDLSKKFKEIKEVTTLAQEFQSNDAVFSSWVSLKRYSDFSQVLGQSELLERIANIKSSRLKAYVIYLAFHRDSKVNMKAALQFAIHPKAFLSRYAEHTLSNIHDSLKPSNYTEISNLTETAVLDLSARELVAALVEGKMDQLSVFLPMEIRYAIVTNDFAQDMRILTKRALGSRKQQIDGLAKNSTKLFSELKKVLLEHKFSLEKYLNGDELPVEGRPVIEEKMRQLIYNQTFGIPKKALHIEEFVAKIGKKSDPEMVLAGNDIADCMPFGDGKSIVYTFNPNTSQFIIQRVRGGDKKPRTFAQSVLTKDVNIGVKIPNFFAEYQKEGTHISSILPESITDQQTPVIACDNVEIAKNIYIPIEITVSLYQDFFHEYIRKFHSVLGVETKKVVIGKGTKDPFTMLANEDNTLLPQAPVSYSDKTEEKVRVLNVADSVRAVMFFERQITLDETMASPIKQREAKDGLEPLTFEQALQVAYVEGRAYSDDTSLIGKLPKMVNELIAKDINNAAKDRPNMSLAYWDKNGKMQGYMLAYEGKFSDDFTSEYAGRPVILISDTSVVDKASLAGAKAATSLIQGFIALYNKNYIDTGRMVPIFIEARDKTSYRLIQRKFEKLSKEINVVFEREELSSFQIGNSMMHLVIIRPKEKHSQVHK